jgi:RHS repeat-associated protein
LRSATARVALPVPTNAEKAAEGFSDNSDSPVIFAYDGYGRRIKIAEFDNGNLTSKKLYWWLGGQIVCERDGIDPSFPILKRYFSQGVQVNGQNLYYTFDQLGSVRELVDSSGVVRADYRYSTYGERTKVGGDLDSDWGYAGLFHHGPSGLDLATYRTYDSKAGRWISRDPLGEGVDYNLYRYCGNNPISKVDPMGLESPPPGGYEGGVPHNPSEGSLLEWWIYQGIQPGPYGDPIHPGEWADPRGEVQSYGSTPFNIFYDGALVTSGVASLGAGGLIAIEFLGGPTILLEGPAAGGGRICQIRPKGKPGWFRLDFDEFVRGMGKRLHYHRWPDMAKHRPWQGW